MAWRSVVLLLLSILGLASSGTPASAQGAQVSPPLGAIAAIELEIVVTNAAGQPVPDLRQEELDLVQEGKRQTLETFAARGEPGHYAIRYAPRLGKTRQDSRLGAAQGNAGPRPGRRRPSTAGGARPVRARGHPRPGPRAGNGRRSGVPDSGAPLRLGAEGPQARVCGRGPAVEAEVRREAGPRPDPGPDQRPTGTGAPPDARPADHGALGAGYLRRAADLDEQHPARSGPLRGRHARERSQRRPSRRDGPSWSKSPPCTRASR